MDGINAPCNFCGKPAKALRYGTLVCAHCSRILRGFIKTVKNAYRQDRVLFKKYGGEK